METVAASSRTGEYLATAYLFTRGRQYGPYLVEVCAARGATLWARGQALPSTSEVRIAVRFRRQILWTSATVLGRDVHDEGAVCSVRFRHPQPSIEDSIQLAVLNELEEVQYKEYVLVTTPSGAAQCALHSELRAAGRRPVIFGSAAEALHWLTFTAAPPDAAIVDGATIGGEAVLQSCAARFPFARQFVLQGHALTRPAQTWRIDGSDGQTTGVRSAPKRLLFVDDEAHVLAGLQASLRSLLRTCEASFETDSTIALQHIRRHHFDVVVSDLRMPGVDGITLMRAVQKQSPFSRRIVLSGHDHAEVTEIAHTVLRKPCPPEILRQAIWAA